MDEGDGCGVELKAEDGMPDDILRGRRLSPATGRRSSRGGSCFASVLALAVALGLAGGGRRARAAPETLPTTAPAIAHPSVRIREKLLYRIEPGVKVADTVASDDVRHVATIETRSGRASMRGALTSRSMGRAGRR